MNYKNPIIRWGKLLKINPCHLNLDFPEQNSAPQKLNSLTNQLLAFKII